MILEWQPIPDRLARTHGGRSGMEYLFVATKRQLGVSGSFLGLHTKRVVGWPVLSRLPEEVVVTALRRALLSRQPAAGLIVHSDRGGQYCSNAYRRLLTNRHLVRSMSRKGECYDNAQAESLWSRVKTEVLVDRSAFASVAEAQAELATCFDYYNHQRRHSALGYECPHIFEQQTLLTNTQLCLI